MAIKLKKITRVFKIKRSGKDLDLPDPNPQFSPEEVMSFYSNQHTELNNSTINGPMEQGDGSLLYEFKSTVGTKG